MAANRRPRVHFRGRDVHRRPHEGSADRLRTHHYPEDIESTVQEITGGRVAAISVPVGETEKLVIIIEIKKRGDSDQEAQQKFNAVKNDVTAAMSKSHGLKVADLVLVAPGSLPTTTSGKVRRAASVEQYRKQGFARLDA